MMQKHRVPIRLSGAAVSSALLFTGCDRLGENPIQWLAMVIPALAILVFVLQFIKDW